MATLNQKSKVAWKPGTFIVTPNRDQLFDLKPELLKTYLALCSFADAEGRCWPSQRTLAERAKCHERTAQRHVIELVKLGFISVKIRKVEQGDNDTNLFQIIELGGDTHATRGSDTADTRGVSHTPPPGGDTSATQTNPVKTNTQNESDSERVLLFWQEKVGAIDGSDQPAARLAASELIKQHGLELTTETIALYAEMRQAGYRYCKNITCITELAESKVWSSIVYNGGRFKEDQLANETPIERARRNKRKSLLDQMAEEKHREMALAGL